MSGVNMFLTENLEKIKKYLQSANAYYSGGEVTKAILFFEKAQKVSEENFGIGHEETANIYNSLGDAYFTNNDLKKAHLLYKKTLILE